MPELPEVETTRRGLEPLLVGRTVRSVRVHNRSLRWPVPRGISMTLAGAARTTEHEMVNMYYRHGDEVRVTHYCAGGNQPTMRLVPTPKPGILQLEFVGITNMITFDDEHMHEGQYQWVSDDRLKTEWRSFKDGRYQESSRFEMARRP